MEGRNVVIFIIVCQLKGYVLEGGNANPPPLAALREDVIASEPIASVAPLPLQPPVPVQETLPPKPISIELFPETIKEIKENNIDFAALYSIIRNNVDTLREHVFSRRLCNKGVCQYPHDPEVYSRNTKYYVTAKKYYSVFVIITLAPRETYEDRIIYQVDLDNILISQLKRQLQRLEQFLPCNKRMCLVPPSNFRNSEDSSYCNYQAFVESCVYVTMNIIIDFEADFDNNINLEKGVAGNTGISRTL